MTPSTNPRPALRLAVSDRRGHKRFDLRRPAKVFRRATQQYITATTRNLSRSGALLEVVGRRPLSVGEIVELAVAFRPGVVLDSGSLVRAIVTRAQHTGPDRQAVALRYVDPAAERLAA